MVRGWFDTGFLTGLVDEDIKGDRRRTAERMYAAGFNAVQPAHGKKRRPQRRGRALRPGGLYLGGQIR
jgi:hypothetical protein